MWAKINSDNVSAIKIDFSEQLQAAKVRAEQEAAEEAPDPGVRAFYLELADWERGHYEALLAQQDVLKEDYWSSAGFAPF